ncbi:hypothetical protein F5Y17DRAFT_470496 [Xylariaceae sp. FL0594]|nr:hypothetical protein F5Y17DRAFT_470496 [Xylariaceae sp. FL0594]
MYVDVPNFHEALFDNIPNLEVASGEILQKCIDETPPRFQGNADQDGVLAWLADLCKQITKWAEDYRPRTMLRPVAQPDKPLDGSVAKRKLDVGFVDDPTANTDTKYNWSHILIPGELKSNPQEDTDSKARLDLGRYVKEVFTAQPTRRFEGRVFVSTILSFLWIDDKSLGFDPTIIKLDHQQYIDIKRDDTTERLIIDSLIRRTPGIVGRATTCWKAHVNGDKTKPLVIKDSWQFLEREDEGKLLKSATEQGVKNVARYYSHATGNVRKGVDVTKASNYGKERPFQSSQSPSQVGAPLLPGKRSCSGSNGCIEGQASLYGAGFLHRDISINNLMINDDEENPSWPSFLIDLDLAIETDRLKALGAKEKTGTRAFMAIGVLSEVTDFDEWNYANPMKLATLKQGTVRHDKERRRLRNQRLVY